MLGEGVIQRQRRQDSDNMMMGDGEKKLACMSFTSFISASTGP